MNTKLTQVSSLLTICVVLSSLVVIIFIINDNSGSIRVKIGSKTNQIVDIKVIKDAK